MALVAQTRGLRVSSGRAAAGSRRPVARVQALFGFGAKKEEGNSDKDEQFRIQQVRAAPRAGLLRRAARGAAPSTRTSRMPRSPIAPDICGRAGGGPAAAGVAARRIAELLEKRRTGQAIKEAGERRRKVSETMASRKAARREEREALGRGEMPESLANWKPYKKSEDAEGTGGIIIPLNPLGLRMYDEGERFDLRSPYSDDGWVDPDETDAFAGIKNIGKKLVRS
ncbi:hypothetical protein MNEG_11088 [Monoraphidium neglectum]|uniref:Uncharacterized protein n=1 Tax=Monoraphidium neglectum TaxID=145388 RepID=A0A0D2JAW2_9CHLO|nr:hypothetical protein MNEG_11088 [Monoraphidium neglectum]KIY96872.1 hypothetical protein MNEG_11088 [Monoraphidium neglectum]|eukprot:XP_013895892.1 hypothetical protein MNEG_11088 [Monoraphidium neglectum]